MRLARLALIPAVLTTAACLEGQRLVTLNADGSGTIVDTVKLGEQARAMLSGFEESDKTPAADKKAKLKEKLTARAAAMGEGVTLVSFEPAGKDGAEKTTYAFKDVTKVKIAPMPDPSNDDSKEQKNPISFRFARAGSSSTLTIAIPQKTAEKGVSPKPKPKPEEAAQGIAMMKAMLKGLKMSCVLEVNGTLVKTNSPYAAGPRVTLMEVDFDQLAADEQALRKLQELDDPSQADPKLIAGLKGLKVHTQPEVTVEFSGK